MFLSFPICHYLRWCSSNFLPLCSRTLSGIQYVLCAYARKFKYLLFVIKFGRASRMGILHRDCAMQRDGSSLSVRENGDLFILIATSFFFSPHLVPVYRFSLDSLSLFYFSFLVSHQSRGSSGTCVVPRATFLFYPLRLLTLIFFTVAWYIFLDSYQFKSIII